MSVKAEIYKYLEDTYPKYTFSTLSNEFQRNNTAIIKYNSKHIRLLITEVFQYTLRIRMWM